MWLKRKWLKFTRWLRKRKKPQSKPEATPVGQSPSGSSNDDGRPDRGEHNFDIMHEDAVYLTHIDRLEGSYRWNPKNKNSLCAGHVTAGWQNWSAESFFGFMARQGYFTDYIDEAGVIYQQGDGDETGPNVGRSKWIDSNGKTIYNLNKLTRGVEMACGGKLKLFKGNTKKSWSRRDIPEGWVLKTSFGKVVEPQNMRYVTTSMGYRHSGWFEILKPAQEAAYVRWCLGWMKLGVSPGRFVEHADVSPDRRSDIGGCLSMPHAQFLEVKVIPLFRKWERENA